MKIIIPFKTPTINHLYWHRGNIKIMKKEAKELRQEIIDLIDHKVYQYERDYFKDKQLYVIVEIYEDWFCKNNTIKKKDIANREKFLIDTVFKGLNIDDKMIFKCSFEKKQCDDDEYSVVLISEYTVLDTK